MCEIYIYKFIYISDKGRLPGRLLWKDYYH